MFGLSIIWVKKFMLRFSPYIFKREKKKNQKKKEKESRF